jgi:hypothetical protein
VNSFATAASAGRLAPPARRAERPLRILFLVSAHNSLSQRVFVALTDLGHDVSVEVVDCSAAIEAAVARHTPELILCPGGLYGSEYWTYLLPRRVGEEMTTALRSAPFSSLSERAARWRSG